MNSDGDQLASAALSATTISNHIESFIDFGGTATASSTGSDDLDFTYVYYARSSDGTDDGNASSQSAYIYAGTYTGQGQGTNEFDFTKLSIIGLAEIVGVTNGDLQDSFVTTNPFS